ncbi:MAG: FAD-binding protein [Ruminococcaceae bacterium]|nr:FAD-binding protein [Oscillospiraceae bacterium]
MDVCIIGAGIAGLTAAIYVQRAGLQSVIFERSIYGGQIIVSPTVDNYPGMPGIDGATLANAVYEQATAQGAELRFEDVLSIERQEDGFAVTTTEGSTTFPAVIFAGGAARRSLGCEGEERFNGRGVSYCATCDGAMYRGKTAAVIGGGNTALEDALYLANLCEKVYIIHRRNEFRGDRVLAEAVLNNPRIEAVLDAQLSAITGDRHVEGLDVVFRDGSTRHLDVSGVFIAIGLSPDTALLKGIVPLDEGGYALAGEDCSAGIPGLFVAGDCRSKPLRQLVTAASDGAVAAFGAANYINAGKH